MTPANSLMDRAARLEPADMSPKLRRQVASYSEVYSNQINGNAKAKSAFKRLVQSLREQTNLLDPSRVSQTNGYRQLEPIFRVCQNLAYQVSRWQRKPEMWNSNNSNGDSVRRVLRCLIDWLLVDESAVVPEFMYQFWLASLSKQSRDNQRLFMHIAAGNSIRGTDVGRQLSRCMVKRIFEAPAHATLDEAIRFAKTAERPHKRRQFPPLMTKRRRKKLPFHEYHQKSVSWQKIQVKDFYLSESAPRRHGGDPTWIIRQLNTLKELRYEGHRLRHCVGTYAKFCQDGISAIFSMEMRDLIRTRPLLTIEITPERSEIYEIKGFKNRDPRAKELEVIRKWASREGLCMKGWEECYLE